MKRRLDIKILIIFCLYYIFLSKSNKININAKGLIFSNETTFKNSEDPRLKLFQNLKNIELEFLHKDNFYLN